jgi:hypothetical protein
MSAAVLRVFDGFPFLSVDFGEGVAHVVPLPALGSRHELQQLAFRQVLAWRRPFALVFGRDDALLFDANGGSVRTCAAPPTRWALVGRFSEPVPPAAAADIETRALRLEVFSGAGSR